ncbi:MAG: hypothetical protein PVF68_15350 [Acidobacteriota bacterium]|jgi:hypothetical protein
MDGKDDRRRRDGTAGGGSGHEVGPVRGGAGSRVSVRDYLLTLPERSLRSISALSAGLLRELGEATLPAAVRRSSLYRNLVDGTLRFLIETVGEVETVYPAGETLTTDYAFRRAAGNGIELAGIVAFRASPVWVMAALADLSGAGRTLVREIADSLKAEGLLDRDTEFSTVDQVLDGLEATSAKLADTINAPPLDVATLRRDLADLRNAARRIPPGRLPAAARLQDLWRDLRKEAAAQERSVFQLSAAMAISTVTSLPAGARWLSRSAKAAARRTGGIVADTLLDHYRQQLATIRAEGFLAYWYRQFRPYLRAAVVQFAPGRTTLTGRLLRRLRRRRPVDRS